MKKQACALGITLLTGCSMLPNLGNLGSDMVRGKISATGVSHVKIAVARGTGADLTTATIVSPDLLGYFTYMIPQNVDALTICAFEDKNNNDRYDDGERTSLETSGGSTYLRLTRMNETWTVVEETSAGSVNRDSLTSADLVFGS